MPDSIIIGAAIVDIPIAPVSRSLFDTHYTPVDRISMSIGGDAANEAMVLAKLGHTPALVSVVGEDIPGRIVLEKLSASGVDTNGITVLEGLDTGINIVLVDNEGERRFITSKSGSLRKLAAFDISTGLSRLEKLKGVDTVRIACIASLFVSHALSLADTVALMDELKVRGLILCADTTFPKHGETLEEMRPVLSRLDYFFPNLEEAAFITGIKAPSQYNPDEEHRVVEDAIADSLLSTGVKHLILKLGSRGCLLASHNERHHLPAIQDVRCIDTTGAGDTFAAAFIAGLLEGKGFIECGRFANAAASLCVESVGAGGSWTREDVERRL